MKCPNGRCFPFHSNQGWLAEEREWFPLDLASLSHCGVVGPIPAEGGNGSCRGEPSGCMLSKLLIQVGH